MQSSFAEIVEAIRAWHNLIFVSASSGESRGRMITEYSMYRETLLSTVEIQMPIEVTARTQMSDTESAFSEDI